MKTTLQEGHAGNYDIVCERLGLDLKAAAVVLLVLGGRHGSGMSVCIDPKGGLSQVAMGGLELASLLRECAEKIEAGHGPQGARYTATNEEAS
jgi:hypothetical protein